MPEPTTIARRPQDHLAVAVGAAALTAVLVVLAAASGANGLLVGIAAAQVGLVVAWVVGVPMPGAVGLLAVGLAVTAVADIALRVRTTQTTVSTLIGVLGPAVVVMILVQLVRRRPREQVTAAIAVTAPVVVGVAALGCLLVLERIGAGPALVAAALLAVGVALVVGHLVDAVLPVPRFAHEVSRGLTGLVAGSVAAAAAAVARLGGVSAVSTGDAAFFGAALGLVAGLVAVGMAYVAMTVTPRDVPLARLAVPYLQIVVPLALSAPVGYVLARAVTG